MWCTIVVHNQVISVAHSSLCLIKIITRRLLWLVIFARCFESPVKWVIYLLLSLFIQISTYYCSYAGFTHTTGWGAFARYFLVVFVAVEL